MMTKDFMTSTIVTIDESVPVTEAARLMAAEDIGSLFVTKNEVLIGVMTEKDIISAQLLSEEAFHGLVARDIMSTPLVSIDPNADLWEVIKLMDQTGKHHIPVIQGDSAIGVVTATDIIRVLATMKLIAEGAED
jgi:CBS domain-containing protein